jgi:hypothetical protein
MNVQAWLNYFNLNKTAARNIPLGLGADLPADEAPIVVWSLQEFQIGESSDGAHLRAAAAWAARHDDEELAGAMALFIAEEQRHAAELTRFLTLNGHGVRAGTRSALLRAICDTFLRDEALHLIFHFEQIARMRRHRSHVGLWITWTVSRLLMGGACAVVWARHRRVLQRGRLTFGSFVAGCLSRLALATSAGRPAVRSIDGRPESGTSLI